MGFRRTTFVLAIAASSLVLGLPALARAAAPGGWHTVTFDGVSLRVPRSWPVLNLSRHPSACPRLNRHAVYLGRPGPDPSCPASASGKTETAAIEPASAASPDSRAATTATRIAGLPGRTNPDYGVTHQITDILPAAGVEVSLSYGGDLALARRIQATIAISSAARRGGSARIASAGRIAASGRAAALARAKAPPPAAPEQGLYQGGGFDTCAAPSTSEMAAWLASPYRAVGIYIGGINRACAQASLTPSWITTIQRQGWHYFPFYVGRQASCVLAGGDAMIRSSRAAAEGSAAAVDAAAQAEALGIPHGTPIIYDMEAYAGCGPEVVKFLSSWDSELDALNYASGVYESFSNISDLIGAAGTMTEPDVIHYADWDDVATTESSYMPSAMWTDNQRLHQYQGGHNEQWGGVTIDIDNDYVDATLGGPASQPPARGSFRVAVAVNTNEAPEWFARAANGTLVHDYQHPAGRQAWSGIEPVGDSPDDITGNPAVTADANGDLTVFARRAAGEVTHAWQQPGAAGGWQWGGQVGGGAPGAITGDPGAARRPTGDVDVFVTGAGGAVLVTRQTAPDADLSWTPWRSIGGSCASSPVPFTAASGRLAVYCITTAGTAAADHYHDGLWRGWQVIAGSPSGLTANPALVSDAAGQTELFATTASHQLDFAWRDVSTGEWTWAAPLASGAAGQSVRRTPAAIQWPDGRVEVFARLAGGQLGVTGQLGSGGSAAWSGWTPTGGIVLGSPAAWLSATGVPAASGLNTGLQMAGGSFSGGAWNAWTEFGGSF
jgi:hypothetical protein